MADVADRIVTELVAQTDAYEARFRAATGQVDAHIAALRRLAEASRLADRMMTDRGSRGTPGSDAAKEANAAVAAVKKAAKERTDAEKAAAREQAEAVKAAEREKAAAVKATAREQAAAAKEATRAAEQRAAAEKAASDAVVAAAEKEAAARVRLNEVAQRAVDRRAAQVLPADPATSRIGASIPREGSGQRGIPAAIMADSGATTAEVEREINSLLADDLSLRARLTAATGEEAAALRDQRAELALIAGYKRAGLTDDQAAVRIESDLAAIEKGRAAAAAEQAAAQRAALEKQLSADATKTAGKVSVLAPTLIGGIGLAELSHLNDEYIRFGNSLRVAGVDAANFDTVQAHLLASSTRTGQSIGGLADTYRSIALASHDLGASQGQILKVTDALANSLRITGASGGAARAAILQLGHAFETGRVTAREFNGLALNAYPLLQAAAAGSDKNAGSVAKLREALIAGDLSSKELFADILKGADALEGRAAKAALTTAQGFTSLTNALTVYFGEADKAQGLSAAFGTALQTLAQNLDIVIPAIAAIATALAVGYAVRVAAAAIETQGLARALLATFGGPVGLAITAVTLAVGAFAAEANRTSLIVGQANEAYDELQARLKSTATQAGAAGGGVAGVGSDALGAIPKVNAFAGAVGNLAQQLYNQARAAKAARIEGLQKQLQEGQTRETALGERTSAGRNASFSELHRGDLLGNADVLGRAIVGSGRNLLSAGRTDRETQAAYGHQVAVNRDLQRQIAEARAAPITAGDLPGGAPTSTLSAQAQKQVTKLKADVAGLQQLEGGATGARLDRIKKQIEVRNRKIADLEAGVSSGAANAAEGGGAGRRARQGPSAETLARRAEAARVRGVRGEREFDRELKQAQSAEASEQADLTNDPAARAEIERKRVRDAAAQTAKEIASRGPKSAKGTGEYSAAEVKQLLDINTRTADLRVDSIDLAERRRNADDLLSLEHADLENQRQALQSKQALATTTAQRRDLAKQLLDLDYKQKEIDLRAVLAANSKASPTERAVAIDRLRLLPGQKAADEKGIDRQTEGRGASYLRGLSPDRKEFIQDEEVKALQGFNQELDNSVSKALHLHGVFGEIVNDLIDMAIKHALIKPLGNALFGGGDSGGSGLLGSLLGSIARGAGGGSGLSGITDTSSFSTGLGSWGNVTPDLTGFANGGSATIGGRPGIDQNVLSINGVPSLRVGQGEQLTVTPQNRTIVPNNAAIAAPSGGGGQITVHVEANDYFDARVAHVSGPIAQQTSVQVVKAAAPHIVGQAMNGAPARVARVQTLGS